MDGNRRWARQAGMAGPSLGHKYGAEQRLSNFLLWQSAHSELYFCDAYWPAFREIDFLRAVRSYAARAQRLRPSPFRP
jgi:short-chain Z-isoprenyl diphosphate synthase